MQANNHVPTFLHPSPLHIHHSHPIQLDTSSNGHVLLLSCIQRKNEYCLEMRKGNPHFEYLLCIENGFVKCLGEGKDDPMISKVDHWLSTC